MKFRSSFGRAAQLAANARVLSIKTGRAISPELLTLANAFFAAWGAFFLG